MDTSRTRSSWNQMFQFQTKPKFRDEYWKSTNLISSPSKPNWNLLRPGMNSSEYSAILQIIPWTGVSWVLKILMSAKKGSNRISVEIPNHHESFSIKTYLISWACGCSTGGWCSCSVRFHWECSTQWPVTDTSWVFAPSLCAGGAMLYLKSDKSDCLYLSIIWGSLKSQYVNDK